VRAAHRLAGAGEDALAVHIARRFLAEGDEHVIVTVLDALFRLGIEHLHGDIRVRRREVGEHRHQPSARDRRNATDGDRSLLVVAPQGRAGRRDLAQPIGGCRRQAMPSLGQGDATRLAPEQGPAEPGFELTDLTADGGLRHMQFLPGGRETGQPGGGLEHADRIQRRQMHL
jgi:hypothetical protein